MQIDDIIAGTGDHVHQYRSAAEYCRRRAANAKLPDVRAIYDDLAEQWDMLAEQAAGRTKTQR